MRPLLIYIAISLSWLKANTAEASSTSPLLPPVLQLVTVDHATASATLTWQPESLSGVAGYVVYRYRNNEGYAIDTIRDPDIQTYTDYSSGALFYSESYVVAAFDSERNISPLSNSLSTIFLEASIDTCNLKIDLVWTLFDPVASNVTGYEILLSEGGAFETYDLVDPTVTTLTISDFGFHTSYVFSIRAYLDNGQLSLSNHTYIATNFPRPPAWIEISSVSINPEDEIGLSINYDPSSEITLFRLERKSEYENDFSEIALLNSTGGSLVFTDPSASPTARHHYRVSAVNRCNIMAITSLTAGNILLSGELTDNIITLGWNSYTGWLSEVGNSSVYVSTGGEFTELEYVSGQDTIYNISYRDLMYEVSDESVCFYVTLDRSDGVAGTEKPISNRVCFGATENIFIPNVFTPDGNGINDFWRPVFSFSPRSYYLVIRSRTGGTLFDSDDFSREWDGTLNGRKLPPDVYLWYLRLITPSGEKIEKSGTVAIIYNL
jgi:gliding motility-associated-like protein